MECQPGTSGDENAEGILHASGCPSVTAGLKITAGQRTMSGLIEALTGQTFDLPVMLTSQN